MLDDGIDWTIFARMAIDHGLAGFAGHTLSIAAPGGVPDDILDAFRMNIDQTRNRNCALFDGLAEIMETLRKSGVEAIPFKGPVLALQAYGDLGFLVFQDLDFLVRDSDVASTMTTLRCLGYEREEGLTEAQVEVVQRLQGQDFLYNKAAGIGVEPHTRLTPYTLSGRPRCLDFTRQSTPMGSGRSSSGDLAHAQPLSPSPKCIARENILR
jgi:hypothetical protein